MSPVRKEVSFSKNVIRVTVILICLYKARIVFYINHLFSKASEALSSSECVAAPLVIDSRHFEGI
jgi:hypothetical protein